MQFQRAHKHRFWGECQRQAVAAVEFASKPLSCKGEGAFSVYKCDPVFSWGPLQTKVTMALLAGHVLCYAVIQIHAGLFRPWGHETVLSTRLGSHENAWRKNHAIVRIHGGVVSS